MIRAFLLGIGRSNRRKRSDATMARNFSHDSSKLVVHQNVVVLVVFFDLATGGEQAALDDVFGIFTAIAQAPFQGLAIWG